MNNTYSVKLICTMPVEKLYLISYICFELSFVTCSVTAVTSTFVRLLPNCISMISPTFTSVPGFAGLPLILTCPVSQASLASVRRFINLDTFKYLSILTNYAPFDVRGQTSPRRKCCLPSRNVPFRIICFICLQNP